MPGDRARIGLHSAWDLEDPRAWSGVITPAVEALESRLPTVRLAPDRPDDALIDRVRARVSPRTVLPAHSVATSLRRSRALVRQVRESEVDALISLASSTDLVLPPGVPTLQITDATFDAVQDFYPMFTGLGRFGAAQGRWVERRAARSTDRYVVTSRWARDSLIRDIGVPAGAVTIAPFGPAIAPAVGERTEPGTGPILRMLFVASDWERKNGAAVLRIVSALRRERAVELVIVGDAPAEAAASATLRGRVDAASLSALYASSDILLEPARANASGVVITDALHHGLPVLAADVGGVGTLVRPECGWLVRPEGLVDEAVAILRDVSAMELASRSRAAAADAAQRLSWSAWADAVARAIP